MGDRVPKLSEASIAFLQPALAGQRSRAAELLNNAVLAEPDQLIQPNDIPIYEDAEEWPAELGKPSGSWMTPIIRRRDRVVAQFEREYLTRLIGLETCRKPRGWPALIARRFTA